MSRNTLIGRLLTPAGFATALALFLLPFLTFSCTGPSTPSEEFPMAAEGEIAAIFTGVDLILDQDPIVEIRQDGTVITIDASDAAENLDDPAAEEQEPMPAEIRAPMIGSAAVLFVGLLLATLIPAHAVRRVLVAVTALLGGGALAYVIYVSAPNYLDEQNATMRAEGAPPGFGFEAAPAVGFWAIIGALVVVLALQVIPMKRPEPAAPEPAAPMPPPPDQYGLPAQPGGYIPPAAGGSTAPVTGGFPQLPAEGGHHQ